MYFAIISTDGDILAYFDDLNEAYEAADETPDAELVAFQHGVPQPPPARNQHVIYGETTPVPSLGLSGGLESLHPPMTIPA